MQPESRLMSVIYAAFLMVVFSAGLARAEEPGKLLVPPRDLSGETYLDAVDGSGLQTDIDYRSAVSKADDPEPISNFDGFFNPGETTGWVILALMGIAIAIIVYRSRYALAELGGPRRGKAFPQQSAPDRPEPTAIDHSLVERLRAEPDPREGLRIVLQRFLALAAQENSVTVKRSLTTREIMQRLPGGFSHRHALETLASEVEHVVFGGQTIDNERYQYCLDLAVPFLRRTEA